MDVIVQNPVLRPEERELMAELLEGERRKLLLEIRHTDARAFREQLGRRMDMVDHLMDKIRLNPE
jgi:hypothetical protein